MANKLEELTSRLYDEGLSKGKKEGEALLEQAKAQAAKMTADAQAEAQKIIANAKAEAADIIKKAGNDVKMASSQALAATKSEIEALVCAKAVDEAVLKAMNDDELMKKLLLAAASNVDADALVTLPETKASLEDYVRNELSKTVGKSLDVQFSKNIKGGFTIAPKDGGYFISFTDESFDALIREYMRPATRKIIFGE